LYTITDPGVGYYYPDSYVWAWWTNHGTELSDIEGRWTVRVYIDDGSGYRAITTLSFVLRYEFDKHLMAHNVLPVDPWDPVQPTNTFCASDQQALTWARFDNVSDQLCVRWEWYEPSGTFYSSYEVCEDDPGPSTPSGWVKFWGFVYLQGFPAQNKTGEWAVRVYVKDCFGNWELQYSDEFVVKECPGIAPNVDVSASPVAPYEGQSVTLNVAVSDNGYLDDVVLNWNDGSWKSQSWNDLKRSTFANSLSVGSFAAPILLEYYVRATDADGNVGQSPTHFTQIQDLDVQGPTITSPLYYEAAGNGNGLLEDFETVRVSFSVSDQSGVGSVALQVDDLPITLNPGYYGIVGPYPQGWHRVTISAVDADVVPAASSLQDSFLVYACECFCSSDPRCDDYTDIFDVVLTINVAFRDQNPIPDSSHHCSRTRTDVDCSGSTDVLDVVHMINVAFRDGIPADEFCEPCPVAARPATRFPRSPYSRD
jgi:hypothetical protein